jgi:REP element-mobilizing transposase RayT
MAQTLVRILVHVIFSTKDRRALLRTKVESKLHRYLAGIASSSKAAVVERYIAE